MHYLRLIHDKVQGFVDDMASIMGIDITVTDNNFVRIGGTGKCYDRLHEKGHEDSMFANVLKTGIPRIDMNLENNQECRKCSNYGNCEEKAHMIHPIIVDKNIMGAISFVAFNDRQHKIMVEKCHEYFKVLKQAVRTIEQDIINIKISNKLNMEKAQVNEIITSINKAIIIINSDKEISHINYRALKSLNISITKEKIIGEKIGKVIKSLKVRDTENKEVLGTWEVNGEFVKVFYEIREIVLDEKKISTIISFDCVKDIINIAMNYEGNNDIDFSSIIGKSKTLTKIIEKARVASKSHSSILLKGESGTGKELFARAIHNASPRKKNAFIPINCAAIPENLLESELFGYEKGSFTGANVNGKIGKFELANNGTIFLDEIGDLPLHLQPKLLRVLQEKEIMRVGGNNPIKTNVRIIAATYKNLNELIRTKRFREDLFYRLNVIPIELPPLRDRENDVLLCGEYILNKICNEMKINQKKLSKEVEEKFLGYDWPGNVRELENVIEYAANFSLNDEITLEDLPNYFLENEKNDTSMDNIGRYLNIEGDLETITDEFQRVIIKKYIDLYGNSTEGKRKVAKKLGVSLTTLYRKIQD